MIVQKMRSSLSEIVDEYPENFDDMIKFRND